MYKFIFFIFLFSTYHIYSATYNTINSGDWSNNIIWSGGTAAPLTGNNNIIYINAGDSVILNDNITFGNGCERYIYGDLIITGNLIALNSLIINVTGSLIINGNIEGKNGSAITISGVVNVNGNVTFDNNCGITMNNGSLDIGGTLTGNGDITGNGVINIQGENNFNDSNGYDNVVINPSLPIVLSSFSGTRKTKNIIELNWVTATETNNHYFDLEKSINGVFYSIGKIIGAGTSNIERKYNYTDYDATESTEYYRLKQVDYDGHFEYFPVISVDEVIDTKDGIIVYPNPSQSELNIHIVCVEYINKITLIDITGKEYVIGKDIYCDGQTFIAISIADIPNGVYFIKFNTNKETFYYDNKIIIEKR